MSADDHLKGIFDQYGSAPEPTDSQRDQARRDLLAAMHAEPEPARPWWQKPAISWSTAAVVAAAIVAFVLVIPTSTPSVDANLADVAAAARTVEAIDLPEGSYIYYRVDSKTFAANETQPGVVVSYLLPAVEDLWVSGTSELRQRTVMDPIFTSAGDEEAFYSSNLPAAEGIGETSSQSLDGIPNESSVDGLPTEPDELREQLIKDLSVDPEFAGDEARILQHIAQLMNPRLDAPPALRAALLEVLGGLDVATERTSGGGVTVLQRYQDDFGAFEQVLEFDGEGFLIRETLTLVEAVDAGIVRPGLLQDIRYSHPTVVAELGLFPAP